MAEIIKHVELVPEGILLELQDGREALLDADTITHCAETMGGFERLSALRDELRLETDDDGVSDQLD